METRKYSGVKPKTRRFGDGRIDSLSALASELVGLKLALIVTGGTGPTRAVKEATSTIYREFYAAGQQPRDGS
jgi:hypothetical protein